MKVCIDAGHGGRDPGGSGSVPFEYLEKVFNLSLTTKLEEILEQEGHWVVMTRRRDRYLALGSRARFANRLGADFFISIHANAAAIADVEGMEVFHYPGSLSGQHAADHVLNAMLTDHPGHKNRGVKAANFSVLRLTLMPAILVECEFLTHPTQLEFLADPDNQDSLARSIARGIGQIQ